MAQFSMEIMCLTGSVPRGNQQMLIPKNEIERMAADLISRHNDPEEAAAIEEHAAWYRSNNFEQGKWRRVRKLISLSKR